MQQAGEVWMRCPDGTRLVSSLWAPESGGPWPVLLMRQPYGRAIASTVTYAHPSWYASHGFLVVVQDVRGRGGSEGSFAGFAQEAADGAATVRWARQLEGGNGRVGTYGFSYQGLSQLLIDPHNNQLAGPQDATAASAADPFPDCLAPAMCGLDERLHWASEGGAHWWALGVGWALQLAAEGCRRREDATGWLEIRRSLEAGSFLRDGLELLERHDPEGMGLAWLRCDPALPEQWTVHRLEAALLRRPMLLIGGWHDPHLRGVLDLWQRCRAAAGQPSLRIGAWSHLDWHGGVDHIQLAFFRRHLGGTPAEPSPPDEPAAIELQCVSSGQWLRSSATALEEATGDAWGLHSGGLAAVRSDEGELRPGANGSGHVVLVHDPWRAVPGRGGHLGPEPGVVDRADLDGRADVACFTTSRLEQPLLLLGEPRLAITVGADQPGFDLCGTLAVLSTDGQRVRQLCAGVARFLGPGCRRVAPRTLRMQPVYARLEPGERLRLSLAGAAWPQVAVNPGDGSMPLGGVGPSDRVITLTLELAGSRLRLGPLAGAN